MWTIKPSIKIFFVIIGLKNENDWTTFLLKKDITTFLYKDKSSKLVLSGEY